MIQSQTLPIYKTWLLNASPEAITQVDRAYLLAESLYDKGGDQIVECYSPEDILTQDLTTEDSVLHSIGLHTEQRLNARWGENSDPELT